MECGRLKRTWDLVLQGVMMDGWMDGWTRWRDLNEEAWTLGKQTSNQILGTALSLVCNLDAGPGFKRSSFE